jgi:uncharacterized membrane protein
VLQYRLNQCCLCCAAPEKRCIATSAHMRLQLVLCCLSQVAGCCSSCQLGAYLSQTPLYGIQPASSGAAAAKMNKSSQQQQQQLAAQPAG